MSDNLKVIEERLAKLEAHASATQLAEGSKFPTKQEVLLRAELNRLKTELASYEDDPVAVARDASAARDAWRKRALEAEDILAQKTLLLDNKRATLEDTLEQLNEYVERCAVLSDELETRDKLLAEWEAAAQLSAPKPPSKPADLGNPVRAGKVDVVNDITTLHRELEDALNEADKRENRCVSMKAETEMWATRAREMQTERDHWKAQRDEEVAELVEIQRVLEEAHPLAGGSTALEAAEGAARILQQDHGLTLTRYQKAASITAGGEQRLARAFAGIAGEAGELNEKWKKHLRGDIAHSMQSELRLNVHGELGDLLWYCAELATVLSLELDDVAQRNLQKLRDRQRRGVIQGDGDDR